MININRLPSEYVEVEYIEATGTQYIDTLYNPTPQNRIIVDFQFTDTSIVQQRIFENIHGETNGLCVCIYINGSKKIGWACQNNSGNWAATSLDADTNRHTFMIDMERKYVYIDNNRSKMSTTYTNNSNYSLLLFAYRQATGLLATTLTRGKIYSAIIYENNSIVRKLIPCYRKIDNEIGLYDLVNNVFHTNAGTGVFLKGENVIHKIKRIASTQINQPKEVMYIKKKINNQMVKIFDYFPNEYQKIECIESTGTQYIDTGYKITNETKFEFDFLSYKEDGESYQAIFGSQYGTSKNRSYMLFEADNEICIQFPHNGNHPLYLGTDGNMYLSGHEDIRVKNQPGIKKHYIYDIPNRTVSIDNLTCISTGTYDLVSTDYSALIFNRNDSTIPTGNIAIGRLYKFKWYKRNYLFMNLIPCFRKSDKELGLYDTVKRVFLTNAGTGKFCYKGYTFVEYIESTGTQYIDLGIKGNENTKIDFKYMINSLTNIMHTIGDITNSSKAISFNIGNSNTPMSRWGNNSYTQKSNNVIDTIYEVSISQNGYYINGDLWLSPTINTFTTNNNMYLFTANGASSRLKGKIYYCKIYNNNVLTLDLIPCYRNSDGEVGMYDLVNDIFYTNAGTGEFTYNSGT